MSYLHSVPYIPASPPRSADVVLYLDLDGVLHHEDVYWHPKRGIYIKESEAAKGRTLFEWLPVLQGVLVDYPGLSLVLSSSWCVKPGYERTLKRLPPDVRARFIGGTYHKRVHGCDPWMVSSFKSMPRGQQILADVVRRKPRFWVALDDDVEDWPTSALDHLVACHGSTGLSCPQVQSQLRQKLETAYQALR